MMGIRWQGWVDFAVLASVLYVVLLWARETRAMRIVIGIVAVYAAARLALNLDLVITCWVLEAIAILLFLALLFTFQAEIRHALMRLDSTLRLGLYRYKTLETSYADMALTVFAMAQDRVGALIIVTRRDSVRELVSGGVALGAEVSPPLLVALFNKSSPLHDGAVIIEAGRVARAGVVLPLTQRSEVPPEFGTRHRAGMGLAERCDALVIVVSEERGSVTLMEGRQIITVRDADELLTLLKDRQEPASKSLLDRFRKAVLSHVELKLVAVGLASLMFFVTFLSLGTAVRTAVIPIEFYNVPQGMAISNQSVTRVEVELRGSPLVMSAAILAGLVARLDLRGVEPGVHSMPVGIAALDLPPGVVVDRVFPPEVSFRLVRQEKQKQ